MNDPQPLPTNVAMVPCDFCGMPCTLNEYHPNAACLMFKACHNSDTVRANLEAVRGTPAPVGVEPVAWAFQHDDGTWHDPSLTEHSAGMKGLAPADQVIAMGRVPLSNDLVADIRSYLTCARDGSMSRNNSEQLAVELLDALDAAERAPSVKQGGQHG